MTSPGPARWRACLCALALLSLPSTLHAQWIAIEDLSVGVATVADGGRSGALAGAMAVGPFLFDAEYGVSSDLEACRPDADAVENCYDLAVGFGLRYRFRPPTSVLRPYVNVMAVSYSRGSGTPEAEYDGEHFGLLGGGGVVVRRPASRHGLKLALDWRHIFVSPARQQTRVLVAYLLSVNQP